MFRNERGACGSRCSSISVFGKEKAVEKLMWFSGASPKDAPIGNPLQLGRKTSADSGWPEKNLGKMSVHVVETGVIAGRLLLHLGRKSCDHRS